MEVRAEHPSVEAFIERALPPAARANVLFVSYTQWGFALAALADVAAAMAAIALKARRLVFMSDVPGLMRDPKDPATVIPHLSVSEVPGLKTTGVVDKGMIPKVDSAVAALRSGVEKVSFVDGRVPHSVLLEIFTDAGVGTEVVLK